MINSPFTGQEAETVFEYSADEIIRIYKQELNMDVSTYFKGINKIKVCKCLDSQYRFYYPLSMAADGKFYEILHTNPDNNYYPTWKWEYQKAFECIASNVSDKGTSRLLEIGCGNGNFLKSLRKDFPMLMTRGLEQNESAVKLLCQESFQVFHQNIEEHASENIEMYDFITAFQVLEHISDVKNFISSCVSALKPGGFIIFGVPNNDSYILKNDPFHVLNLPPHHMGLWNHDSLKSLPNYFTLKVVNISAQPPDYLSIYYTVWLKKYFPKVHKILHPIFIYPARVILKIYPPKLGHTIFAVYQKI